MTREPPMKDTSGRADVAVALSDVASDIEFDLSQIEDTIFEQNLPPAVAANLHALIASIRTNLVELKA